ncbi:hypothetical protein BJ508DRAFT_412662 [Ascobolus immersus RN42]|uniref:Uncharacterized protein n=1 Tax=Ascobolus immersus RN42 TaxID=1160509 RepID=A0A3N4IKE4_ASCIM|nr:hypothetical protein BJ508DRAFT_412662 [Ascobolus immersus RN42]
MLRLAIQHTPQLVRTPTTLAAIATPVLTHNRLSSTVSKDYTQTNHQAKTAVPKEPTSATTTSGMEKPHKKTMAELDAELMAKLEEMSGDGGVSGLELENGKPVAMKRSVRENMFRLI